MGFWDTEQCGVGLNTTVRDSTAVRISAVRISTVESAVRNSGVRLQLGVVLQK